jgi:AT-rich interactive domain-containing protein 2
VSQAGGMPMSQGQAMQGQLVKSSTGQLFLKTTSSSGGAVLVPAGQQSGQGGVLVQQGGQKLLLVNNQGGRQMVIGNQGGQQSVVRVSAPLASVPSGDQHVTQIDGAEEAEEVLPQLDGTGDEIPAVPTPPNSVPGGVLVDSTQSALPTTNGRSTPSSIATPPPSSPTPSPSPPPALQPTVKIDTQKPFLCEWAGCMKAYKTPKEVENHAIADHCSLGTDDIPCLWARCDGMRRKRFSLMTHLQDRHCHPQLMKLMAVRRVQIAQSGKSDVPLPPAPPPHPGYAPNAALHAIKRHAVEFVSPKELAMRDEKEGPVTKSIRLTASLILRNLVIYSSLGRSRLRAYESHLSTVALSNVESSRTVSQILFDLANSTDFQ